MVKKIIRVDLACGQTKESGWIGIDIAKAKGVDIVHDLEKYPWPFKANSVDEVKVIHYLEHVPMNLKDGRNGFFAFFNELDRIMKKGAKCTIISPYYNSMRAWQDPTHTRAISEATFLYTNAEWRKINKLDHYPIHCDFDFTYGYQMSPAWVTRSDESRTFALAHYTNVVADIHVTLTKR